MDNTKSSFFPTDKPLEIHSFADVFPLMEDAEFQRLVDDIRQNGQRQPIIVSRNKIIDGRNRAHACQVLKIEPRCQEWNENGSIVDFIISMNLVRRHLNESQRAMVAARLANLGEGRPSAAPTDFDSASIDADISQSDAAEMLNVSRTSVQRACEVIQNGVSEIIEAVETGEISVSAAAEIVKQIPRTKQKRLIRKGRDSLKKLAGQLRVTKVRESNKQSGIVCLLCNPELEITEDELRVHLVALQKRAPKFARYFEDILFEMDELDFVGEIHDTQEKILVAIDAGHREKIQIRRFTGLDLKILDAAIANMLEYGALEIYQQQGKSDQARGQLKTLYRRPVKAGVSKEKFDDFEDECARLDAQEGFADGFTDYTVRENHLAA